MSAIVPGGDQLRNAILRRKEINGRCSWCFSSEPVPHHSEERYIFIRDLFHCTVCQQKTVRCREKGCSDFARGYEGLLLHDQQCYHHQKIIDIWEGSKTRDQLSVTRTCSWCFKQNKHTLVHYSKRLFECNSCSRVGALCKGCDVALSRNGSLGGDKCLLCSGHITEWSQKEKESHEVTGWCSVCFEYGTHSLVEKKKKPPLFRRTYICNACSSLTARCTESHCHNLVRGTITHRKCQKCSDKKNWDWEAIQERKQVFLESHDPTRIVENLARETLEKKKAFDKGMIRPFLFLVSMHPAARNALAVTLQIYLLRKSFYGDPHLEADYILFHPSKGLLFRGSERFESMRNKTCSWYKLLRRVEAAVFKGKDIGEALGRKKAKVQSSDKGLTLELNFMEKLASQQRAKFSEDKEVIIDKLLASESFRATQEVLEKNGIPPSLHRWLLELLVDTLSQQDRVVIDQTDPEEIVPLMRDLLHKQIIQGQGYFYTKKRQQEVATKAATVGVTIAVQQLIIIPLVPAVGIAYIMFRISDALTEMVWGSEPEALYPTVQQILTQRLFLAYSGINVDDFYTHIKTPVTPHVGNEYNRSIFTVSGVELLPDAQQSAYEPSK